MDSVLVRFVEALEEALETVRPGSQLTNIDDVFLALLEFLAFAGRVMLVFSTPMTRTRATVRVPGEVQHGIHHLSFIHSRHSHSLYKWRVWIAFTYLHISSHGFGMR